MGRKKQLEGQIKCLTVRGCECACVCVCVCECVCVCVCVLWAELSPKKICSPGPVIVTLFGIGSFRCNQFRMRSLGWPLVQYDWCPFRMRRDSEMVREKAM
jgi:hypothetical protein